MQIFTFFLALCAAQPAAAAEPLDSWIVLLEPGGPAPSAVARAQGVTPDFVYDRALSGFSADLPSAAAEALAARPGVRSVTRDRTLALDAQTTPTGVSRIGGPVTTSSPIDVGVAIVDSGIAPVSDLYVVEHVECKKGKGKDAAGTCSPGGTDDHGHGTHVAGTVGALDDGSGVVGVAPGAPLYGVKVCQRKGCDLSAIVAGLDWVAARAADIGVVNMSLGGEGGWDGSSCDATTDPFHAAICGLDQQGVTVVVAAGNESADATDYAPASYPEAITVSALEDYDGQPGDDRFASFSNYGPAVDLIAPGVDILSTGTDEDLTVMSGTSMATPHVAGAAALVLHEQPGATPADVRATLIAEGMPDPCDTGATCPGDPDGIAEPLVWIGTPLETCTTDADCSVGVCDADGTCVEPACTVDADCADADACTVEQCVDGGTALAACQSSYVACGSGDGCCGPDCTGDGTDPLYDPDCPVASAWMHVEDLAFKHKGGRTATVEVSALVFDGDGLPVEGATVSAMTNTPDPEVSFPPDYVTATTDAEGKALLITYMMDSSMDVLAEVQDITHPDLAYDSAANLETCRIYDLDTRSESDCN